MLVIFTSSGDCIAFSFLLSYVHSGCMQQVVNQCLRLFSLHIPDFIDKMESGFKMESLLLYLIPMLADREC